MPGIVRLPIDTFRLDPECAGSSDFLTPSDDHVDEAVRLTALPGGGNAPLTRLEAWTESAPERSSRDRTNSTHQRVLRATGAPAAQRPETGKCEDDSLGDGLENTSRAHPAVLVMSRFARGEFAAANVTPRSVFDSGILRIVLPAKLTANGPGQRWALVDVGGRGGGAEPGF